MFVSVGNNLAAVSGTIEIDALTPVSGEIDSRRSGPRFPRPHLTRIATRTGSGRVDVHPERSGDS